MKTKQYTIPRQAFPTAPPSLRKFPTNHSDHFILNKPIKISRWQGDINSSNSSSFVCQFVPFYAWGCELGAISAHGWLMWTDVGDVKVPPLASHMWKVESRPICESRVQHLTPHWVFTLVCTPCYCMRGSKQYDKQSDRHLNHSHGTLYQPVRKDSTIAHIPGITVHVEGAQNSTLCCMFSQI